MIEIRCPVCMKLYPLHLEHEHKCAQKSSPSKKPTTSPVTKTEPSKSISPSSRRIETVKPPEPVKHPEPVSQSVSHPVSQLAKPKRDRTAYQRELMRKRRAADRARQKAPE